MSRRYTRGSLRFYHDACPTVFPFGKFPAQPGCPEQAHLMHTGLPIQDAPNGFPSRYTMGTPRPEIDIRCRPRVVVESLATSWWMWMLVSLSSSVFTSRCYLRVLVGIGASGVLVMSCPRCGQYLSFLTSWISPNLRPDPRGCLQSRKLCLRPKRSLITPASLSLCFSTSRPPPVSSIWIRGLGVATNALALGALS